MYDRPTLSLSQVQGAMNAMIAQVSENPDQPVAIAMVDDAGEIISYAKMDNCRRFPQRLAIKKAYTAALRGVDSQAFADQLKEQGRTVMDFGDPSLVAVGGGIVVRLPNNGPVLGGIGVSGLPGAHLDEALARVGLNALGL